MVAFAETGRLLVKEREAARMLSISSRKLWELNKRDEIPCIRADRAKMYDVRDLVAWITGKKPI